MKEITGGERMDIWRILNLLGGVALFLYGMELLGVALKKLAGGKTQKKLEKLTSNRLKGFFLGLITTAVIQSSSATTVMILGFINSGLMKIGQACSVIIGANVGTTVTAWLLSTAGVSGTSVIANLLKPSAFVPVLALVGVGLRMFSKRDNMRNVASILLGFSVLMFGMEMMSDAVEPLSNDPLFLNLLTVFSGPLAGLLIGLMMTVVLQSSSAAVGILQALSMTGVISLGTTIPIIMGQNIGASMPVLISAIGSKRETKRTALLYLLFNVFGAVLIMALYFPLKAVLSRQIFDYIMDPFSIACLHTGCKALMTAVLLPLSNQLIRFTYILIPDSQAVEESALLDMRLIETPAVAVAQARETTLAMAKNAQTALLKANDLIFSWDTGEAAEVEHLEETLDHYEDKLGTYLVKLSDHSMTPADGREDALLLHMIGDFERIGDHAVNLKEAAEELFTKKTSFSEEAKDELLLLREAVQNLLSQAITAFSQKDVEGAKRVEPLEQVVDYLTKELKTRHIDRLRAGKCTIELGFIFMDIIGNLERVADHCSNIAAALIESSLGSMEMHDYTVHAVESDAFHNLYCRYLEQYALPDRKA